jgi:peptidoglycan/LPS O-acetylase OafA/YrhL
MKEYEPIFAFILALMLLLIIDIYENKRFSGFSKKLIKINASYSYTLYLTHYSILDFLYVQFKGLVNPYILFVLGFVLSNIVSFAIGYYSENILTSKVKSFLYRVEENRFNYFRLLINNKRQ